MHSKKYTFDPIDFKTFNSSSKHQNFFQSKKPPLQFKHSKLNNLHIVNPIHTMNPFFQDIQDLDQKKHGHARFDSDVQEMAQHNIHNPNPQNFIPKNQVTSPMNSHAIQRGNYSIQAKRLMDENKNFFRNYKTLREALMNKIDPNKSLFTVEKWKNILQPLDEREIYLTIKQRLQLSKIIYYLLKVQFGVPFTDNEQKINLLSQAYPLNEYSICQQAAADLSKLKKKISNRKQQTIKVLSLIQDFSTFKTDFSQLSTSKQFINANHKNQKKGVDERAFELCKNDIYAFSFVTLYLMNCINTQLKNSPEKVFDQIKNLKDILKDLTEKYPAGNKDDKVGKIPQNQVKLIIDESYKKGNTTLPQIKLTKPLTLEEKKLKVKAQHYTVEEKVACIEDSIVQRAKVAKNNKIRFDKVLKPLCLELGSGYCSGLKIRTDSEEDKLTKYRAFQKIVYKKSKKLQKFEEEFKKDKEKLKEQFGSKVASNTFNKVLTFNNYCCFEKSLINVRNECALEEEEKVQFQVLDMLRGKAVFKSRQYIIKTANRIFSRFQQISSGYYQFLQFENRLNSHTKDFQMNLLINSTMCELQLVLNLDKSANEFNHKLYELKRSKDITPLVTLYSMNWGLAEKFLLDQLELFYIVRGAESRRRSKQNREEMRKLIEFARIVYLNVYDGQNQDKKQEKAATQKEQEEYSNSADEQENWLEGLVFSKDRQRIQKAINGYLHNSIEYCKNSIYKENLNFDREPLRKTNQELTFTDTQKH